MNILRKNKTLLVVFIGFIILGGVLVIYFKRKTIPQNSGVISLPQDNPARTNSNVLIPIEVPEDKTAFYLTRTDPSVKVIRSIWDIEPIVLYFNDDIDLSSVQVTSMPDAHVKYGLSYNNPKALSIIPMDGWSPGVEYQVSVSKNLKSKKGKALSKDLTFTYTSYEALPGDPEYPKPIPEENQEAF